MKINKVMPSMVNRLNQLKTFKPQPEHGLLTVSAVLWAVFFAQLAGVIKVPDPLGYNSNHITTSCTEE